MKSLQEVFQANRLSLSDGQADSFSRLTEEMLCINQSMNLTAITDPYEISVKHYADCALMAEIPFEGATVADIGAGAGFPTLPLGILRPDLKILAVDSTAKRMRYVAETAALLGLSRVSTLTARAEEMGKKAEFRESFDFVTARAVASLNVLCELCLPLVRVGGTFCALKAANGQEELNQAQKAVEALGGAVKEVREISLVDPKGILPADSLKRMLILVEKIAPTPSQYPRRYARIQANPL